MKIVTKKKYKPTLCPGCEEKAQLNYNGGGNYTLVCKCDETGIWKSPDEAYEAWEVLVKQKAEEELDNLITILQQQMSTDEEDPYKVDREMLAQHKENPKVIDNFLMTICGWSLETLIKFQRGEMK